MARGRAVLQKKLMLIYPSEGERGVADTALAPVVAGVEGERVAVACLKLAGGDLVKLEEFVSAALTDYRDILAWAESPRQMRLGPRATPEDQQVARRADAEEYARWLGVEES
jgi:hypothetical protein